MTVVERSLLGDDALVVRADGSVEKLVSPWLPLHAAPPTRQHRDGAMIEVVDAEPDTDRADGDPRPLLVFGGVHAFAHGDVVELRGTSCARGRIALDARRATVHAGDGAAGADVYSMLTLAAALLVGRLGGALVHAAAVVDPDGRAWLLVGDTHAGKTTTCVSLVDAGWRWLADDQVVLRTDARGEIVVEGWPRRAHLDEGWSASIVTGTRGTVDLRERWGDRWLALAPLGGVLLPTVRSAEPTRVEVVADALAFAALVRQSPWLMADRGAARPVMTLLQSTASRPALALSLGGDGYARGDVLAARLALAGDLLGPSAHVASR